MLMAKQCTQLPMTILSLAAGIELYYCVATEEVEWKSSCVFTTDSETKGKIKVVRCVAIFESSLQCRQARIMGFFK